MAYEVQNFEDGQKLTAEQLNHMEDGIYANSANMAYEKQNFVNGQKLTAEQLNHMEAGIYANSVSSGSSGSGTGTLPTLTNPAAATDLALDKQLIDGYGNVITGTLPEVSTMLGLSQTPESVTESSDHSEIRILSGMYNPTDGIIRSTIKFRTRVPTTEFGNAEASQVAKGATFTSAAGLLVEGTMESGSSSGGLTVKTGTTTSNVIETGLSSIDYFVIQRYPVTGTGFNQGFYVASADSMTYTYCSSVSEYLSVSILSISMSDSYSVAGGTFTWNESGTKALSGSSYTWYAFGTE